MSPCVELRSAPHVRFTTDGRLFSPATIPIISYSPAEEDQAHVANESISIQKKWETRYVDMFVYHAIFEMTSYRLI